jgi:hypothetical protein
MSANIIGMLISLDFYRSQAELYLYHALEETDRRREHCDQRCMHKSCTEMLRSNEELPLVKSKSRVCPCR